MIERIVRYRRLLVVVFHLALIVGSNALAFWLRFSPEELHYEWRLFWAMLPYLLLVRAMAFAPLGLYEGLWRYTSVEDVRDIVIGVAGSSAVTYLLDASVLHIAAYPASIWLIDSMVLILAMFGARLGRRLHHEFSRIEMGQRVLIYGAADAGEAVVREMRRGYLERYKPIAFIDNDPRKKGQRIHGVRVIGTLRDLPKALNAYKPDFVLVAMPELTTNGLRETLRVLEPFKVPIKILPNLHDMIDGHVRLSQVRDVSIEDLLPRPAVRLDDAPLKALLRG